MKFINFNLTKVFGEVFSAPTQDFQVDSSLNISSIEENPYASKKEGSIFLNINFNYVVEYVKKIAKIEIAGRLVVLAEDALGKEILKQWKKKALNEPLKLEMFNAILTKTNIRAIQVEDELGLPPHFKLPSLSKSPKKE